MGLAEQLSNIDGYYGGDRNTHERLAQLRRLIVARGPLVRLVAYDSPDEIPDDHNEDGTLIFLDRPAEEEPNEDTWAEELPFSEPLEGDD